MFGVEHVKEKKVKRTSQKIALPISFKSKKVLLWIAVLVFIALLIGYYLYDNHYSNYNYIKKDVNQYLVYTKETSINSKGMRNEIPEINIDSKDAQLVNDTIINYAKSFLKDKNNLFVYTSQLNGEVLSVLLKMLDYREGYSFPTTTFHTYNFNLKTQTLMSNDDLLALFNVTEEDVEKKIKGQFESYYNDEVSKGFLVSQECDYNCFLKWRNVDNYMNDVYYYVRNGQLIAYRSFDIYSVYGEEEYFDDSSYEFYISK